MVGETNGAASFGFVQEDNTFRTGKTITVGFGLLVRNGDGVGSRFRATTSHMKKAFSENDSRPLPQNATLIYLPVLTQLDDPRTAQRLADRFLRLRWRGQLNRWVEAVHPVRKHPWFRKLEYYWVIDQAEYATDVIFRDRQSLQALYPRLLDYAAVNFSAGDILTFLGRRLHWRFGGEVLTECKKDRWPGARIKHRMKGNWLKMYDKQGVVPHHGRLSKEDRNPDYRWRR
jgi:hypothetical protein